MWSPIVGAVVSGSLFTLAVPAAADGVAAMRAARERIIGPAIASGPDYTVHSPQAEAAGSGYRCKQPAAGGLNDSEYSARLNAIQQAARDKDAAIMKEKTALMNARRARPPMPYEDYLARMKILQEQESANAVKAHEESKQLEEERRRGRSAASDWVAITLQHAPRDPAATIIPFAGQLPSAGFVAELNRVLRPFLSSCGDRGWVTVSHVYRDLFPFGRPDENRGFERTITAFNYTLSGGALVLDSTRNTAKWVAAHGLSNDARFTLASARSKLEVDSAESARASAAYRREFADASKRKPGVVYKLDPYWEQYRVDPTLDAVRRVFDGDFTGQKGTWQFKSAFFLFGDIYSQRCRSEVPKLVQFRIPYSEIVRTRTYLDGHVEHDRETRVQVVEIDKRFTPQWGEYRPAFVKHILEAVGAITREMGSLASAPNEKILEAIRKSGQVSMFVRFLHNHECASAAMVQMRENLVRAANDRPALQAEGVRLANAERESDPAR